MNQQRNKVKQLVDLADIILEKELKKLSAIGQTAAELEHAVQELDQALHGILEGVVKDEAEFALGAAGHLPNWQNWRRHKRAELTARLAAIRAEQEKIRSSASLAFGRVQALRQISQDV